MKQILAAVLAAALTACGGGSSTPAAPTARPTATPTPTPTPNPYAEACGTPLPPLADAYGFGIKVQLEPSRNRKVLNASPLIRNSTYCRAVGLPGQFCNTRREGSNERVACDHYMSGVSYTGRPGPNWFQLVNGQLLKCGGFGGVPDEGPSCGLKENDQYLLDVSGGGLYRACPGEGSPGPCGSCILDQSTFGVIHASPAGLCQAE